MVRRHKTYYELARSQVDTPAEIVDTFWTIFRSYRDRVASVLDLGAGDGRFAKGGSYDRYLGIEIDASRGVIDDFPENAKIVKECAFRHQSDGYGACVGNPPYVRHHDLESEWRDTIAEQISEVAGVRLNRKCNLYVYFLFLALFKTTSNGLVAAIVPYEWLSRPSAKPLRDFISKKGWDVDVYRFDQPVFKGVETTASISVIDKRVKTGVWRFYSIDKDGEISRNSNVTGSGQSLIDYDERGEMWAMRGLSPGTQKVFTLTEGQRIHAGLKASDVYPCITSMKGLPTNLTTLTQKSFKARFVDTGTKCWLIKSDRLRLSNQLSLYLDSIPKNRRDTATCNNREPWYRYVLSPAPDLLVSSGFVGTSPKAVINTIGARNVGSIYGIYDVPQGGRRLLQEFLTTTDFAERIVAHSGKLRKLEVRQLNALLNEFSRRLKRK